MSNKSPHIFLEQEYLRRKSRNRQYSLRGFAQHLNIPSGRLSQYLNQKRRITVAAGHKLSQALNLSPEEEVAFMNAIKKQYASSIAPDDPDVEQNELLIRQRVDEFQLISDPFYFELLSYFELEKASTDCAVIAKVFSKTEIEIKLAIQLLERLGLIVGEEESITLIHIGGVTTSDNIPNRAIRKCHEQILENTIKSLEEVSAELRDISSITMAIDCKKLSEAKVKIRKFKNELCEFLEAGAKNEVYRLNIQLVPCTGQIQINERRVSDEEN